MKFLHTLLLFLLLLALLLPLAACGDGASEEYVAFDYEANDMTKYISLSRDSYIGASFSAEGIPAVSEVDIAERIQAIKDANPTMKKHTDQPIQKGDVAYLYYRGTLLDGTEFDGGSNFAASEPQGLVIGSGAFVPGFEDALIGKLPQDTKAQRRTEGTVTATDIVYLNGSYSYLQGGKEIEREFTGLRLDLTAPPADHAAFAAELPGEQIGGYTSFSVRKDVNGDGVEELVSYNFEILFAAEEITFPIQLTMPLDYRNEALAGQAVIFHIAIIETEREYPATIDAAFITTRIPSLASHPSPTEALPAYLREKLEMLREDQLHMRQNEAFFNQLLAAMKVKKYPKGEVEHYIEEIEYGLNNAYKQNNYYAGLGYENFKVYPDLDSYAQYYFDLEKGENYRNFMRSEAQKTVKQSMLYAFLIQQAEIDISEDALAVISDRYFTEQAACLDAYTVLTTGRESSTTPTEMAGNYLNQMGDDGMRKTLLQEAIYRYLTAHNTFTFTPAS